MFEESKSIFDKVYSLAKERREIGENEPKEVNLNSAASYKEFLDLTQGSNNKTRELANYLEEQDDETIMRLETIMYLGRDQNYIELGSPESIYMKNREEIHITDKNISISQMVGKEPLDEYLLKGYKILGIN